jgi:hypothetical protein
LQVSYNNLGEERSNITCTGSGRTAKQEELNLQNLAEVTAMAKCQKTLIHFCSNQTTFPDSWSYEHVSVSHTYKQVMHKQRVTLLIFKPKAEHDTIYNF